MDTTGSADIKTPGDAGVRIPRSAASYLALGDPIMRLRPVAVVLTALLLVSVAASHAATLTVVAKEGDQLGGGAISALEPPSVNDAGQMAFGATRSFSTRMLVLRNAQGGFSIVAQTNDAAPGTSGAVFGSMADKQATLNEAGQVLFDATLEDGVGDASDAASNRDGVWLATGASLAIVARDRDPIPDVANLHYDIAYAFPLLDEDGRVAYLAYSLGKTSNTEVPDTMVLGTPPNMDGVDSASEGFDLGASMLTTAGGIWTAATGIGNERRYFVRTSDGGAPTTLIQDGDAAPGGGTYESVHATDVNAAGTYVGAAFIGAPQSVSVVFSGQGTSETVVAKGGDALPGGVGTLDFVALGPLVADDGSIAFVAGGSANTSGLFRVKGANTVALAVDGQQAQGLPAGVVYSALANNCILSMNSSGQVAFRSRIAGPGVTFSTNVALFLADVDGTVHLLARTGDTLTLGANVHETISDLDVAGFWLSEASFTGGSDGRPRWLTDSGTVAFRARYDDGFKDAIVVAAASDGPAPTATPTAAGTTKTPTPQPTATASFGDKGPTKCRAAIASASSALVAAESKAVSACHAKVVAAKLPAATDCRTETKAAAAIAKAHDKLGAAIARACGGKDKTCGAGGDDVALELLGWSVGTCPGVGGGSCGTPIGDCGGVATCVTCVGDALVDRTLGVVGALVPTDPTDKAQKPLVKCQAALAKATATYLRATTGALTKCWEAVNAGKATGACPGADAKTVAALAKAEDKKIAAICKACGGPDKQCGGDDDFAPGTIGFPASCPDVTPPAGVSCAATPTSLADVVACVDCVADFSASCATGVAVPHLAAYAQSCRP
jgi:hypothetical protein